LVATAALPGLFAPGRRQGRWLVDGGALNNLSFDVARRLRRAWTALREREDALHPGRDLLQHL
jgi:predicted acylesterase/phospholipase RssA